jgi:2-C-methyl-D-erythritol 4-phosphate cytidylyltransferase
MQSSVPKQYLPFQNKTVIEITLDNLLSLDAISGAVVVLNRHDSNWESLNYSHPKPVLTTIGADQRSGSVLNGLKRLEEISQKSKLWVMIHDAVRPCITHEDLDKLIESFAYEDQGLFLAHPVTDTLKRSNDDLRSIKTVDRTSLWRALTPQMFAYDFILTASLHVIENNIPVTDDVSAVEALGFSPKIILGRSDNIKITYPQDILMAETIIKNNKLR